MALESASAAETLIQSNADNDDLEDGEIPSDEDDEPVVPVVPTKPEASKPTASSSSRSESSRTKSSDSKSSKSKKSSSTGGTSGTTGSSSNSNRSDRFGKYKNATEDWAGDVEKAIRAALDGDKSKDSKSRSKRSKSSRSNSCNRGKKRSRDEKEDDRSKDQKKRKVSDDENGNEDDDEMLFVRGASPVRKEAPDGSPAPSRRSNERENFENNSDRDSEERPGRNREAEKRSSGRSTSSRRGGSKNDRSSKNKARTQVRNERNGRRNQTNEHNQDPDAICVYYMQGKCHRGDDCPFSHNAMPPRKMELCKFYLMDCCAKRDKCLYMHHDFPCKFFHTGLKCTQGDNCKFSHEPLNEQVKNILLKHLETAPKEILGDFPRLSRDGALMMINNTAKSLSQDSDSSPAKIPSLFDVPLPAPASNASSDKEEDMPLSNPEASPSSTKRGGNSKDRKPAGKKTRWGSDEDRVPLDQIVLLQTVSQLGLHLPNVALNLVQQQLQQQILLQQCIANMDLYTDAEGNKIKGKDESGKDSSEAVAVAAAAAAALQEKLMSKDIDLRQLLAANGAKASPVVSIADAAANLAKSKYEEESDHDEELDLVIAVPADDEDKAKESEKDKSHMPEDIITKQLSSTSQEDSQQAASDQEALPNLPKKAQELFLRIQQQQRAANESVTTVSDKIAVENALKSQEDWYSDDDDEGDNDDDDEEEGSLQIVLKDSLKDESEKSDQESPVKETPPSLRPSAIPQPAVIVDKLGDLSKIDISAEVTKLLSSIKTPSGTASKKASKGVESCISSENEHSRDSSLDKHLTSSTENGMSSPTLSSKNSSISRDPRMSRDPRQRRAEDTKPSSPSCSEAKKESGSLRLETSIYSSGITEMDSGMESDFRTRLDQDHRRHDMDFRQHFQDFGDTDLRIVGSSFKEGTTHSDVDFRQMMSLPFKPAPSHVPCTEIDASIGSHSSVVYKVYVVDIPRPNYTGLKLKKNDALVKYDPRLRKIFRLPQVDIADSPMSPPPVSKHDSPKSPPLQIRTDPRRKALEVSIQSNHGHGPPPMMHGCQPQPQDMPMGMPGPGPMPGGPGGMGMPMGQNPMMGNMGPIRPPPMGGPPNMPSMGMPGMGNVPPGMGPNGPPMGPNQGPMGFDPRFRDRNGGPGLLGPAPVMGFPDHRDVGPNFDGPGYPPNNFGGFGPVGNEPMMGYGPSGPGNMNFGGNGPDWAPGNPNPMRRGGRIRRRNRNRANAGCRNNRSPQ